MFAEYSTVNLIIVLLSWKLKCIATSPWSAIGLKNIQIEETVKKKDINEIIYYITIIETLLLNVEWITTLELRVALYNKFKTFLCVAV